MWFGLGLDRAQQRLRLGPFYSRSVQPYKTFVQYFVGQLLMYDRLVAGMAEDMLLHICMLVFEVLQLGWPQHYVSNAVQSIPRRHRSPLVQHIRFMGVMRKRNFHDMVQLSAMQDLAKKHPLQYRVLSCMAPPCAQDAAHAEAFPFTGGLLMYLAERLWGY